MCNPKKLSNLCTLAKIAKERLMKNDYTADYKPPCIDNALCFAHYVYNQKKNQCDKTQAETIKQTYDEELYQKVCEMIEQNNLQNPISRLIDKQLFSSLDTEAKQYYINNLSQKFKVLKSKYYREHDVTLMM